MAFGIPNASDLNGIVTNLGTIVAALGPEETAVITQAIQQLSDHANALEDKAIAATGTAEDRFLQRLDTAIAVLEKFAPFAAGVRISVLPEPSPTPPPSVHALEETPET